MSLFTRRPDRLDELCHLLREQNSLLRELIQRQSGSPALTRPIGSTPAPRSVRTAAAVSVLTPALQAQLDQDARDRAQQAQQPKEPLQPDRASS
jgi:hypothetical protein